MSLDIPDASRARRGSSARLGVLALSAPPLILAVAAITGLGLVRGTGTAIALGGAFALVALPAIGLGALIGRGPVSQVAISWLWPLVLLLALPLYFPGERAVATREGVRLIAAPAGGSLAAVVADAGVVLVSTLGADPAPTATAPIAASPSRPGSGAPPAAGRHATATRTAHDHGDGPGFDVIRVPYEGDAVSLRVNVDIDGPELGDQFEMIFDTGATYTTIHPSALDRLGIAIPGDAPWVTLRTANGEIRAPLVLVDAFWLGDAVVEWVTVAVCDACAGPPSVGLLGLNFSRQFRVSIDHDHKRIELRPRQRGVDRALDIAHWLDVESRAAKSWDGALDLELTGRNRARHEIESAIVNVECNGDAFAIQIDDIPPGGEATTQLSLPRGTDCSRRSSVVVSRGRWRQDRF